MKNTALYGLILTLTLAFTSCAHWGKKEWSALKDRSFTFSSFYVHSKFDKKKRVFSRMKSFPLEKVSKRLGEIYGIAVEADEFTSFIDKTDYKKIKQTGLIFKSDFTWRLKKPPANQVTFEMSRVIHDGQASGIYLYKYSFKIISGGEVRARFFGEAESWSQVYTSLLYRIKTEAPVVPPGLTPAKDPAREKAKKEKKEEEKLENLLKDLSPRQRELLKKKLANKTKEKTNP